MEMDVLKKGQKENMAKAIEALKKDFKTLRTGRANPSILEQVMVDYYGSPTPISNVGNITVPEPQMIMIAPWEKNLLREIEQAILKSDLGMTPQNDGNIIRLPVPPFNEERRKEMVKKIKHMGEDSKISIRNTRRDGNEKLKKDKVISLDEVKRNTAWIQKLTDKNMLIIDKLIQEKENELMEV